MDTLLDRAISPETARNLSLLVALVVLAWRPAAAVLRGTPFAQVVYELLVCGVGLLALLRFDAAMVLYATSAFPPESAWLRGGLPGLSAAMYAATWSLIFGGFLPWVFQRADMADGPQTWRERLAGGLLAVVVVYLVAFFVAPLPSALEQALISARTGQQAQQLRARHEADGQRLVAADAVCAAARSLYLEARTRETATSATLTAQVAADLDAWRTGVGLPGFGTRSFQGRCADVMAKRHVAQVANLMQQWSDLAASLRKAGVDATLPRWPDVDAGLTVDVAVEAANAVDLSAYVLRTATDPLAQVQWALARTDGATVFQLAMELVLVLMAWPATRVGRWAPDALQPGAP
jgi:hypothetical protein